MVGVPLGALVALCVPLVRAGVPLERGVGVVRGVGVMVGVALGVGLTMPLAV